MDNGHPLRTAVPGGPRGVTGAVQKGILDSAVASLTALSEPSKESPLAKPGQKKPGAVKKGSGGRCLRAEYHAGQRGEKEAAQETAMVVTPGFKE